METKRNERKKIVLPDGVTLKDVSRKSKDCLIQYVSQCLSGKKHIGTPRCQEVRQASIKLGGKYQHLITPKQ